MSRSYRLQWRGPCRYSTDFPTHNDYVCLLLALGSESSQGMLGRLVRSEAIGVQTVNTHKSRVHWSLGRDRLRMRTTLAAVIVLALLVARTSSALGARSVVSLAPSVTEIVFALGEGGRLVGVSSHCDYPEQAKSIDRVGTFLRPSVEVILKKKPDLVLAVPSPENRASVEALQRFGVTVQVVNPNSIAEILESIVVVADALDVRAKGEALVKRINDDMKKVRSRLRGVTKRRVLMLVGRRPLIAAGPGTYQSELIELAGGSNVAAGSGEAWPHLSMELVLTRQPEVIIDTGMTAAQDAEQSSDFWRPYSSIPAVRERRVVGSGRYDLLRPGPRVAETLAAVARFIHPEVFPEVLSEPSR